MAVNRTVAAHLVDHYVLVTAGGRTVSGRLIEFTYTGFTVVQIDDHGRVTGSEVFTYADVDSLVDFYADFDDVDG
jgi:uncharacterized protein Veg